MLPRLTSLLGLLALLLLAWAVSTNRRRVNPRLLLAGLGGQLLFALFVFQADWGRRLFAAINEGVMALLGPARAGQEFLFGPLASREAVGPVLATQVLPAIVFVSALVAVLYHWGILPALVRGFAWLFTRGLRLSGAESLCAASNIFVGVESGLTVKPHLGSMTRSELNTILTVAMATVASNTMIAYIFFLSPPFENIAGHLVSASILSAPAALVVSKLLLPETGTPETLGENVRPHYEREPNLLAAIVTGANTGLKLIFGIAALLLAVVSLVALVNLLLGGTLGWLSGALLEWRGVDPSESWVGTFDWSLQGLLAFPFSVAALCMGVPWAEAWRVGLILGERAVLTEFVAYPSLAEALQDPAAPLSPRSAVITAYALCGFAHLPSVGIFLGGFTALAPERTQDLGAVAGRALFGATLACLMTGCMAGLFYTDSAVLFAGQ